MWAKDSCRIFRRVDRDPSDISFDSSSLELYDKISMLDITLGFDLSSFAIKWDTNRRNAFIPIVTSRNYNSFLLSVFPATCNLKSFKTRIHRYLQLRPNPSIENFFKSTISDFFLMYNGNKIKYIYFMEQSLIS